MAESIVWSDRRLRSEITYWGDSRQRSTVPVQCFITWRGGNVRRPGDPSNYDMQVYGLVAGQTYHTRNTHILSGFSPGRDSHVAKPPVNDYQRGTVGDGWINLVAVQTPIPLEWSQYLGDWKTVIEDSAGNVIAACSSFSIAAGVSAPAPAPAPAPPLPPGGQLPVGLGVDNPPPPNRPAGGIMGRGCEEMGLYTGPGGVCQTSPYDPIIDPPEVIPPTACRPGLVLGPGGACQLTDTGGPGGADDDPAPAPTTDPAPPVTVQPAPSGGLVWVIVGAVALFLLSGRESRK